MSDVQLTTPAKQALIALVLQGDEATNPVLYERFGLKIEKKTRELLLVEGLIEVGKGLNNAATHTLTERGWRRGRTELAAAAPNFTLNAGPAWGRLLYGVLTALDRVMTAQNLQMADVFPVAIEAAAEEPREEIPAPSIEDRVLSTYRELAARDGDLVSLALLRGKLAEVPRADLDGVLRAMDRDRRIQLEPDPSRGKTPPEAKEAAIRIGGEDKYLLTIVRR